MREELKRIANLRVRNELIHFKKFSEEMVVHMSNRVETWDELKSAMLKLEQKIANS